MRRATILLALASGLLACAGALAQSGQEPPLVVLSPKAKSGGWAGVHKPHTKLADVLARHAGKKDWTETVSTTRA